MKFIVCIICILLLSICVGCSTSQNLGTGEKESASVSEEKKDSEKRSENEESEMEKENRKIIADALGISKNSKSVSNILEFLDIINSGKLQSAVAGDNNGDRFLDIVAEDGTNFHILLSRSGNVDAIKNVDTGEWVVQSYR